jgi:hypothetical protein
MSGISIAQRSVDVGFRTHGFAAQFVAAGVAKDVTVLVAMPDVDLQISTAKARDMRRLFKLRTSEVAEIGAASAVVFEGETLPIRDAYHAIDDPYRLVWTLECGDPV